MQYAAGRRSTRFKASTSTTRSTLTGCECRTRSSTQFVQAGSLSVSAAMASMIRLASLRHTVFTGTFAYYLVAATPAQFMPVFSAPFLSYQCRRVTKILVLEFHEKFYYWICKNYGFLLIFLIFFFPTTRSEKYYFFHTPTMRQYLCLRTILSFSFFLLPFYHLFS